MAGVNSAPSSPRETPAISQEGTSDVPNPEAPEPTLAEVLLSTPIPLRKPSLPKANSHRPRLPHMMRVVRAASKSRLDVDAALAPSVKLPSIAAGVPLKPPIDRMQSVLPEIARMKPLTKHMNDTGQKEADTAMPHIPQHSG